MLIFGLYQGERLTLDVTVGMKVKEVREMIQTMLNISSDINKHDKKVLVLSYGGSDLQDPWVFSDLAIVPGTTIRVNLKEEVKPVLYIHCSHSQETLNVFDTLVIGHMHMEELRSLASRKTGLPVGIFRLVTKDGTEMYDGHRLEDYGIDVGHTVWLENLDGWNEFLNLAIMGFTPQVLSQISTDEFTGRYQMKVALFLAAHHGHVDLARAVLRQSIKASEAVGYPPQRMWCTRGGHVESKRAPVHQAVEMGQLGVLRLFVNTDISVLTATDGDGLMPMNIALRKKIKNCASFLLTKQWSKVNVTKSFALHIGTYTCLRQWCDRAKERAFIKYGQSKSSLKRRPLLAGPLVGCGVCVDGFTPSIMTGKSKAQLQEKEREKKRLTGRQSQHQISVLAETAGHDPEAYFRQVTAVQNLKTMGDKVKGGRLGRLTARATSVTAQEAATTSSSAGNSLPPVQQQQSGGQPATTKAAVPALQLPNTDRSEREPQAAADVDTETTTTHTFRISGFESGAASPTSPPPAAEPTSLPPLSTKAPAKTLTGRTTARRPAKESNRTLPVISRPSSADKKRTATTKRKKKRKGRRVTSALLLSKATANEGAIPLPIISNERDRRPFFYYNGQREEAFVEPTIDMWSQHTAQEAGATPRERAIRSLSVANTFKEKPWLSQVRIALKVATNPTRRSVRRLGRDGPAKRTFAF